MILATILFLVLGTTATAAPVDETADKLKEAEHQARLEAEYQHALTMSEKDRHAA